jgi:hypothetical protein
MGATTSMVVAAQADLKETIACVLLWVPDAKSDVDLDPQETDEEGGQKFKNRFWLEAQEADFFGALEAYRGGIHLVYGETDRYVTEDIKQRTIAIVTAKGQPVMILAGQDHSPWEYDVAQRVYAEEIRFLKNYF